MLERVDRTVRPVEGGWPAFTPEFRARAEARRRENVRLAEERRVRREAEAAARRESEIAARAEQARRAIAAELRGAPGAAGPCGPEDETDDETAQAFARATAAEAGVTGASAMAVLADEYRRIADARAASAARLAILADAAEARAANDGFAALAAGHARERAERARQHLAEAEAKAQSWRERAANAALNRPPRDFLRALAALQGVAMSDLAGLSRIRALVKARHEAMAALALAYPSLSLPGLARHFGDRDHTTVLNALQRTRFHGRRAEAERLCADLADPAACLAAIRALKPPA